MNRNQLVEEEESFPLATAARVNLSLLRCHLIVPDECQKRNRTIGKVTEAIVSQGLLVQHDIPEDDEVNDIQVKMNLDEHGYPLGMYIRMYDGRAWRSVHYERFKIKEECCMDYQNWFVEESFDIKEKVQRALVMKEANAY